MPCSAALPSYLATIWRCCLCHGRSRSSTRYSITVSDGKHYVCILQVGKGLHGKGRVEKEILDSAV